VAGERFDVAIVGSHCYGLFMDCERLPVRGESLIGRNFRRPEDGGKGSNQAICAGRLGASVLFIGKVGNDEPAEHLADWFARSNVDARFLYRSPTAYTGLGFVLVDAAGEVMIVSDMGANAELTAAEIDAAAPAMGNARFFLTQFEVPPALALHGARLAKQLGLTTVLVPAPMAPLPDGPLAFIDVILPNETEARLLAGHGAGEEVEPARLVEEITLRWGVPNVVVTRGARGVHARCEGRAHDLPAFAVPVVNTTGAGDAFAAGMVVALARGADWGAALEAASAVAAIAVQQDATWPAYPTPGELRAFLATRGRPCPI
jgi:ribokinase